MEVTAIRVYLLIQLISQVLPPSSENACQSVFNTRVRPPTVVDHLKRHDWHTFINLIAARHPTALFVDCAILLDYSAKGDPLKGHLSENSMGHSRPRPMSALVRELDRGACREF